MIVSAENLVKKFDALEVVRGISFSVAPGECFGFLGPNGAGKTTIIRMIHGGSPVGSGSLTVFGLDITSHARQIKARLGVVPQDNNLDDDLSVLENLLVYARYFGIAKDQALSRSLALLNFVQLESKNDNRIPTLSGGMKRRLILARGLLNQPELLILDEPSTGLDPQARRLLWQKLRSLKSQGTTMILTTHYMEEAEQLCDRVAIMDAGKIILQGNPIDLVRERVGTECYEMEPAANLDGDLGSRLRAQSVPFHKFGETYYIFPAPGAEWKPSEFPHRRLLHRRATLEDLFLQLTGKGLTESSE
ncbi:MAG TPA: ATP-binding cassette domain-containing protein [Acidobacteriota bacterium]|jgi:lipooligosaccharide transport system ATP-binding protein